MKTVLPLSVWLAIVVGIAASFVAGRVHAEPRWRAEAQGAVIVLHSDKCELAEVSNLPFKATWEEKGVTFTGCWAPNPDVGIVVGYFKEDRSVAIIPIQVFKKVTGV